MAGRFGDLDLADDSVQDALVDAHRTWDRDGVPDNPGGWLMATARRRAIDRVRADRRREKRWRESAPELYSASAPSMPSDGSGTTMIEESAGGFDASGGDERLRLLLLCCHPALDEQSQVALTLRLVGGLTTTEIARGFVLPEPTVAQRIVRAKRKIRTAAIPMSMPVDLTERLDALLGVVYLVFNEGYLSQSDDDSVVRIDLAAEAIRLARLIVSLAADEAEPHGLLALLLCQHARSATRVDSAGDLVLLPDQDRSRWDLAMIGEGNDHLMSAMSMMEPGSYQIQAVIAAEHSNAREAGDTDWPRIAALYEQLHAMTGSPVVGLNRAVAVAEADGPLAGLALLERLLDDGETGGLVDYHLYWTTVGELHRRAGDAEAARSAFERARTLPMSAAERRLVERRLA